jgi:hypothetical protein
MGEEIDTYQRYLRLCQQAEERASGISAKVHAVAEKLGGDWKKYYITGLGDVPAALLKGGKRIPVDVSQLQGLFAQLNSAMAEYAESFEGAQAAWARIPDKSLLKDPPWLRPKMTERR